jgi:MbtH protein
MATEEDKNVYVVVMNHEEQYSIWLEHKPIPDGWRLIGQPGSKNECLEYVKTVWTDMRPLSLRQKMDADQQTTGIALE